VRRRAPEPTSSRARAHVRARQGGRLGPRVPHPHRHDGGDGAWSTAAHIEASARVPDASPELFLAILSQTPSRTAWCAASHDSHSAALAQATQHVPERVDDASRHESLLPAGSDWLVLPRHRQQLLEHCRDVVDVPVHDRPARVGRRAGRRPGAVDEPQLGLGCRRCGTRRRRAGRPAPRARSTARSRAGRRTSASPPLRRRSSN
jgi:hypothetical protein